MTAALQKLFLFHADEKMVAPLQNLFAQQSMEQSEKIFAHKEAMAPPSEPGKKAHTLEEYSFDHFRWTGSFIWYGLW